MRRAATIAVAVAALAVAAQPAWGHAALEQAGSPPNADAALTMRVPVEPPGHEGAPPGLDARHNERVLVVIPDGFQALSCDPKPGWACAINQPGPKTPLHIAWTRQGTPYEKIDAFTFKVHTAAKPGAYPFNTIQQYNDGDKAYWDGEPDSDNAAPTLQVG